jgi:hypothetical protein
MLVKSIKSINSKINYPLKAISKEMAFVFIPNYAIGFDEGKE